MLHSGFNVVGFSFVLLLVLGSTFSQPEMGGIQPRRSAFSRLYSLFSSRRSQAGATVNPVGAKEVALSPFRSREELEICQICWNMMEKDGNTDSARCRHMFHRTCLERWRESVEHNGLTFTCPTCRKPVVHLPKRPETEPGIQLTADEQFLVAAARTGNYNGVLEKLRRGVSASIATYIFLLSAAYGHTDFVKELLRFGVDIDSVDVDFNNALMFAVLNDQEETAEFLIEAGIQIGSTNSAGISALDYCTQSGNSYLRDLISKKGRQRFSTINS